jgi:hypothetical protein
METFLSIGISNPTNQNSKDRTAAHLKKFSECVALPKHLLPDCPFDENNLGNPTDESFYTNLYNTFFTKGVNLRKRYQNLKTKKLLSNSDIDEH